MARFRHIQNSFRAGEISPSVFGRTDLDIYQHGAAEITNMIVQGHGGARRRPGTQFVSKEAIMKKFNGPLDVNISGSPLEHKTSRIIPFIFNRTEAYAIVFSYQPPDTGLMIFKVSDFSQATITKTASSMAYGHTAFTAEELNEIQFAQSGDLIFFTHPNHVPFYLIRTAVDTFELSPFNRRRDQAVNPSKFGDPVNLSFGRGYPFRPVNTGTITLSINTAGPWIDSVGAFFTADHVGSVFKITDTAAVTTQYALITGIVTSSRATIFMDKTPVNTATDADWEESAFSPSRGWPRSVCFFEQRLIFGGTESEPDTIYASETGDVFEFDILGQLDVSTDPKAGAAVTNSDQFNATISSTEVNEIQWLASGNSLFIGTLGGEYIARGSSGALGPLDISISSETTHGSAFVQPAKLENVLVFASRAANRVREMVFNRDQDSFTAEDLSVFADHFAKKTAVFRFPSDSIPKIRTLVKQEGRENVIWILDNNDGLYAMTRNRSLGTVAWHYHKIGGDLATQGVPVVTSIASIPSADGTNDDLWMAVQRTINGGTKTYIERMNAEFSSDFLVSGTASILDKMVYVDSAVVHMPGGTFTVFPGLSHLEGETVQVMADGEYVGEHVVSSGQITLSVAVTEAVAGLKYISQLKTLKIEAGSSLGTAQTAIKRIDQIAFRFYRTIGGKFGSDEGNLEVLPFRKLPFAPADPIPLFTGDKVTEMPSSPDREGQVIIRQDLPLPQGVVSIIARGIVYD